MFPGAGHLIQDGENNNKDERVEIEKYGRKRKTKKEG